MTPSQSGADVTQASQRAEALLQRLRHHTAGSAEASPPAPPSPSSPVVPLSVISRLEARASIYAMATCLPPLPEPAPSSAESPPRLTAEGSALLARLRKHRQEAQAAVSLAEEVERRLEDRAWIARCASSEPGCSHSLSHLNLCAIPMPEGWSAQ